MNKSKNHYKKYTEEEDSMLEEWVSSNVSYRYMAEQLGRTIESVSKRIERLGVEDKHVMTGTISATELATIIHYEPTTVIAWIRDHGLPATKKPFLPATCKSTPYYIIPEDFWKWAETRRDSIQFSDMERNTLLPEPLWLEEELKKEQTVNKRRKFWTPKEDDILWSMYYDKSMPQKDIAETFSVSVLSVRRRIARIRNERWKK